MNNDSDTPEDVIKKWEYRSRHWEEVVKQQFQLAYYGKVSYTESQDMPIHEREFMFGLLLEQKALEKKAHEDAVRAAEEARKNK